MKLGKLTAKAIKTTKKIVPSVKAKAKQTKSDFMTGFNSVKHQN